LSGRCHLIRNRDRHRCLTSFKRPRQINQALDRPPAGLRRRGPRHVHLRYTNAGCSHPVSWLYICAAGNLLLGVDACETLVPAATAAAAALTSSGRGDGPLSCSHTHLRYNAGCSRSVSWLYIRAAGNLVLGVETCETLVQLPPPLRRWRPSSLFCPLRTMQGKSEPRAFAKTHLRLMELPLVPSLFVGNGQIWTGPCITPHRARPLTRGAPARSRDAAGFSAAAAGADVPTPGLRWRYGSATKKVSSRSHSLFLVSPTRLIHVSCFPSSLTAPGCVLLLPPAHWSVSIRPSSTVTRRCAHR
jgi:hypothetical protein